MMMVTVPPVTAQRSEKQADYENSEKYPEKDQSYAGDGRSDSSKAKNGGNNCQY